MWLLLIATVTATFFIQRWHLHYFPPSAAAMLLGMLCGGLVKLTGKAACNNRLETSEQASGPSTSRADSCCQAALQAAYRLLLL